MPVSRCALPLLGMVFTLGAAALAEDEEPSQVKPLRVTQVANPARFFNKTPEQIFKLFGRPADITYMPFDYDQHITHVYDVEKGGCIGIMYAAPWHVVAIVYDNLDSTNF